MNQITDHVTQAVDMLIGVLKTQPRASALVRIFAKQIQELEDVFFQIRNLTDLETAVGEQQNVLGRLLQQERLGMNDARYKLFLKAAALLNRASGTVPEILAVFLPILPAGTLLDFTPYFPAAYLLTTSGSPIPVSEAPMYADIQRRATAAGVGWSFHWNPAPSASTFTFNGTAAQGFGAGVLSGIID